MISVISSAYSAYRTYTEDENPKKTQNLLKEMECRLNQLPRGKEKSELAKNIQAIKTAGKTNDFRIHSKEAAIHLVKVIASNTMGPIGSAAATFFTHDYMESLSNQTNDTLRKATIKAGSRKPSFVHKQKIKTSAINETAKTALFGRREES